MKQQKKNWPAESNMTALKTLSHTLLHLDIQPTKMSPLVVKHPFTDSGLAGIYAEDGSLSVGNLLDSPDALRTWRENFSRRINEAETAMNLFCMITKPYQFGYLRLAAAHLSEQDMASFLSYAWISTESPNNDPNLSQRELLSMFRSLDPQKLMDQEEYTQFQNLDDVVTVYRGVTSYNANNIKALSWTLNREVAEWFVHRYGEDGIVYEAQINKEHTYALFWAEMRRKSSLTPSASSILSHPHHKSQFRAQIYLCSGSQKHFSISDSYCCQSVVVFVSNTD